jgi:nitroimidazol reductase NimA-like FMN-containing flavoprotein (pyridoxamine 5'-phosphate oxidase superfamily)
MRRTDKEITDQELISRVIQNAQVCRLGLARENIPYILPVSFGYDGEAIYFHTAKEGRKIEFLAANNRLCFEFEHDVRVITNDSNPCKWTFSFQSVIGYGYDQELTEIPSKIDGLNKVMRHYSGRDWTFSEENLEAIKVWRITIESLTGKQSKDKFVSF